MSKMNKKQDVRDKVKEIKLRQQNWLKQRAESKDYSGGDRTPPSQQSSSDRSPAKSLNNSSRETNQVSQSLSKGKQTESPAQSLIASKKSKARFESWLKAKQEVSGENVQTTDRYIGSRYNNDNTQQYRSEKYSDNSYTDTPYRDHQGSGNVNILRVPSTRSPEFATPDPGWNSDDETGEINAVNLLSAEDFDTKADDIIAKVKGDMGMSNNTLTGKGFSPGHPIRSSQAGNTSSKSDNNMELSSHVCTTCDKLMMAPNASPMLLIPCGHTLCKSCCMKTKYCAMCGCSVQSNTPNIMLQQIISNYHSKQQQQQQQQRNRGSMQKHNNYVEEFHNLEMRQEILSEEQTNIAQSVEKLMRKVEKDRQQLSNIERKEKKIETEIASLQEELQELSQHKQQYERNVYESEMEAKQEKNKLILVQDSLRSVQQQMEKVKYLAEDL